MTTTSRLASVALATLVLSSCGRGHCERSREQAIDDLPGGGRLVAYVENCGATIDFATVVILVADDEAIEDGVEIFRAYHSHAIGLRRVARDTVAVLAFGEVREQRSEASGVQIVYPTDRRWHRWMDSVVRAE